MKKVGICACYDTLNYGSMLQAFATQYIIDHLGYKSEFIVYQKVKNVSFYFKGIGRLLNRTLWSDQFQSMKKRGAMLFLKDIKRKNEIRKTAFYNFQKKYYRKFSEPFRGFETLCKGAERYSTVLVGSDQLWLPGGLATNFYNLMFVPDKINKVSYATSFGVKEIPWYQVKRTQQYLSRIHALSVREKQGQKIIETLIHQKAEIVADPTMLLTKEQWETVIPSKSIVGEPYIFCYFLGTNAKHRKISAGLKEKTGLKIVTTPFLDNVVPCDISFGDFPLFNIGPDDFVNLIRNAEYVLTDSFHASVFSLIFHKQFVVFDRFRTQSKNSRNSRIDSLCDMFEIWDRRYQGQDVYEIASNKLDYRIIDSKLKKFRCISMEFLEQSLI